VRLRKIGPPRLPPKLFRSIGSEAALPTSAVRVERFVAEELEERALEAVRPDLVTTSTTPPANRPYRRIVVRDDAGSMRRRVGNNVAGVAESAGVGSAVRL
jgi:hypothetical protein